MFIYYEWTEAILEYAPNKMIISLNPSAFLFIEDWAAVRHLKQPHANIYQFCMKPPPLCKFTVSVFRRHVFGSSVNYCHDHEPVR